MWDCWFKIALIGKWWKVSLIIDLAKLLGIKVEYYSAGTGTKVMELYD
jgi:hypothetical protein